jgi:hypothetical protein
LAAPPPTKPNPPRLLHGDDSSRSDNQISVEWDSVSGASSYDLQLTFGVVPTTDTRISVTSPATLHGLKPNRVYAISVRASNASGTSPWSDPLMTATRPSQPSRPSPIRLSASLAMVACWNVDLLQMDRPEALRVDVGRVFALSMPSTESSVNATGSFDSVNR